MFATWLARANTSKHSQCIHCAHRTRSILFGWSNRVLFAFLNSNSIKNIAFQWVSLFVAFDSWANEWGASYIRFELRPSITLINRFLKLRMARQIWAWKSSHFHENARHAFHEILWNGKFFESNRTARPSISKYLVLYLNVIFWSVLHRPSLCKFNKLQVHVYYRRQVYYMYISVKKNKQRWRCIIF